VSTIRWLPPNVETNPWARRLFGCFGFKGGPLIVSAVFLVIVVTQYAAAWWSCPEWMQAPALRARSSPGSATKKRPELFANRNARRYSSAFIDRVPKIRETLQVARRMVDDGYGLATMGNHEFNAIRYQTPGPDGEPLSPNGGEKEAATSSGAGPARRTLPRRMEGLAAWFKRLPLFLDLGRERVVHAACQREAADLPGNAVAGQRRNAPTLPSMNTRSRRCRSTRMTRRPWF